MRRVHPGSPSCCCWPPSSSLGRPCSPPAPPGRRAAAVARPTGVRPSRAARTPSRCPPTRSRSSRSTPRTPRGLQVAHQVFQGLDEVGPQQRRRDGRRAGHRRSWDYQRRADVDLPPEERGDVPVAGQPRGRRLRTSSTRGTGSPIRRTSPTCRTSWRRIEGCDDRGYQIDPAQGLTGVTAIDDQTLQVTLRYPFADFPATLGHPVAAVTPVEYIDKVGAKAFAKKPVGTGPYVVKSWKRRQGASRS